MPDTTHPFIEDAYFKPFASARHVHYGVEAALKVRQSLASLMGESEFIKSINSIVLKVYPEAATYAGNRDPQATITGQFSLSLGVASALRFGHMDPKIYDPALFFDPELRHLERMVEIEVDPDIARSGLRQAVLCVKTINASYEEKIEHLMGDPRFPMSESEVEDKFTKYSAGSVKAHAAQQFIQTLFHKREGLHFADAWQILF